MIPPSLTQRHCQIRYARMTSTVVHAVSTCRLGEVGEGAVSGLTRGRYGVSLLAIKQEVEEFSGILCQTFIHMYLKEKTNKQF